MLGKTYNTLLLLSAVPAYDCKEGTYNIKATLIRRYQDQDSNVGPHVYDVVTKEK